MSTDQLELDIEALIFSSKEAIDAERMAEYINNLYEEPIATERILASLENIEEKYKADHFPFEVKKVGGGYQFLTKKPFHPLIAQINGDKYNKKLSATAMETLSIIAYRQPITKSEIEHIRGVGADYAIHKLLEKDLITITGRDEEAIGKPLLYATSKEFFDFLGINDKAQLPQLKDLNTELLVVPTDASEAVPEAELSLSHISVNEDGSLIEERSTEEN